VNGKAKQPSRFAFPFQHVAIRPIRQSFTTQSDFAGDPGAAKGNERPGFNRSSSLFVNPLVTNTI
jgi:hypothetical protein